MRAVREHSCDDSRLQQLLLLDDDSQELSDVSIHVESCRRCQNRLMELAASVDDWNETRDLLSDSGEAKFAVPQPAEVALDFLAAPSHPEMLGRIGSYEIEKVIGAGGMGVVLKGHDGELNRPVAIKVLAPHLAHNGAARQRFAREGRAAAAVVHEHVVPIHSVDSDADMPFLVMHYVPGQSLQTRVDQDGPLPATEILRIGIQMAAGLAAAHAQGVIHRDIKPSNILLEHSVERVLLTDFGLARAADDASLTQTGILAGTPHYMSPEQASGDAIDTRSDLFSLGAVLYFMATGRPPFRAERAMAVLNRICHQPHRPVWEINPDVPDELCEIIDQLLEKKPRARFSDAADVQSALSELLVTVQQPGRRRLRTRVRRWIRRRQRWLRGAAGAIALCGLASLATVFSGDDPAGDASETGSTQAGGSEQSADHDERVLTAIAGEQRFERNFVDEISEVQAALRNLEADHFFGEPGDPRTIDRDAWQAEIADIHQRLSAAEESLVIPSSQGAQE